MYRTLAMLYSGGHKGAEAAFGRHAEAHGVPEVTLSFEGHTMVRETNVRVLSDAELAKGDVSMEIVSRHMGRTYSSAEKIRRVIQSIFHMVNSAQHVFAIGWIQADDTVKGGTGWAVELAKFFNRDVSVYDQDRNQWFTWIDHSWQPDEPTIPHKAFCGTGTRNLTADGEKAIEALFDRSFGQQAVSGDAA
ncbi:MAG: hypothetical protein MPN21_08305 [Thermoanaerobaculia bacterium]|nr:hypothetical protein [Thermoanaerobaculia bacterium]